MTLNEIEQKIKELEKMKRELIADDCAKATELAFVGDDNQYAIIGYTYGNQTNLDNVKTDFKSRGWGHFTISLFKDEYYTKPIKVLVGDL